MTAKDAILQSLGAGEMITQRYLNDLDDGDLVLQPVEGMNPIAWHLGHLVSSERSMVEAIKPGSSPPLPEGFDAAHSKESSLANDHSGFLPTKAEYLELTRSQRAATKAVLEGLSEADLDAPSPERLRGMWPTIGAVFMLMGSHTLMHVGQYIAVRKKLHKPVAI